DAFAMSIGYFENDYLSAETNASNVAPVSTASGNLYNGNIANITTNIKGLYGQGRKYQYDQLNRLIDVDYYGVTFGSNKFGWGTGNTNFASSYSYDANGNLLTLSRNSENGSNMDDLEYYYQPGKNRLSYVVDGISGSTATNDIECCQTINNYTYENNGELK